MEEEPLRSPYFIQGTGRAGTWVPLCFFPTLSTQPPLSPWLPEVCLPFPYPKVPLPAMMIYKVWFTRVHFCSRLFGSALSHCPLSSTASFSCLLCFGPLVGKHPESVLATTEGSIGGRSRGSNGEM